jgi:hypothetical protein
MFTIVFNHGGEFVRENNNVFYKGGDQTIVNGQKLDEWSMSHVINLVNQRRYEENGFRIWRKFVGYANNYFELIRDDMHMR